MAKKFEENHFFSFLFGVFRDKKLKKKFKGKLLNLPNNVLKQEKKFQK